MFTGDGGFGNIWEIIPIWMDGQNEMERNERERATPIGRP